MIREMVKIDEDLCDGCGACIPSCHEGALQMIDGKARLISDLMCDGLGACLGHCPQGAITIEKREAEPYNETRVMELMVDKGENTVVAHLQHLKEHHEMEYLREGVQYLKDHRSELDFSVEDVMSRVHHARVEEEQLACGCAGSEARSFAPQSAAGGSVPAAGAFTMAHSVAATQPSGQPSDQPSDQPSELRQWPVQMHLINPGASYFRETDLVLAADCVAFSLGNFHSRWLKGKTLAIACPKLDTGMESYVEKIRALIDGAKINTLTVMMMQVPCCGGLLQMVRMAAGQTERKVPIKKVIVGVEGEILSEEWV
ncbi:MAG: 4Fe-4S ferredoxin [Bacteroidetes bacterium]|nr:MAG: 4Fe-4S ferredoxin [Bacteroidota bacterium]